MSNLIHTKVRVRSAVALVAQVRGTNRIRLVPDEACQTDCLTLEIVLAEGEVCKWRFDQHPKREVSAVSNENPFHWLHAAASLPHLLFLTPFSA